MPLLFSTAKAAAQELHTTLGQLVTKWRLCSAKKWSCEVVGSHQFSQEEPGWFCIREDLAFLTIGLTFHDQWHVFRVRRQKPHSGSFACLASHPSLATCKGATIVVTARCQNCSPKLCWSFGANGPRSLQQMQLKKYIQLWDAYQPALSQMVLKRDCAVQKSKVERM